MSLVLVNMPFAALERPSLALGLLAAIVRRDGMMCHTLHANMLFASRIGVGDYHGCCVSLDQNLLGEWIFAPLLFGARPEADELYWQHVVARCDGTVLAENIQSARDAATQARAHAAAFVPELATRILDMGPTVVGCTSLFAQHLPSLVLLQEIKRRAPQVQTILGGANCEGVMGLATHRNFPCVDFVVSGEADTLITPLLRLLNQYGPRMDARLLPAGVVGPVHRERGYKGLDLPSARIDASTLDSLPTPDFDEYFSTLREHPDLLAAITPGLPVETSRGCWWGAAKGCLFCGLNGERKTFRRKRPKTILRELNTLATRYGVRSFETTDNIMAPEFPHTLLPRLREAGAPYKLFFETKSSLSRTHLQALREAGVIWIQPGVESLDSRILTLMRKGCQAWQNIRLLKYCRQFGIQVSWNLLCDFPGEDDAWYKEMAEILPLLHHLSPTSNMIGVRFDRFSPFYNQPQDWGLELRPAPMYALIYDLPATEISHLAYFFEDARRGDIDRNPILKMLLRREGLAACRKAQLRWRAAARAPEPPRLEMRHAPDTRGTLVITDTRSCRTADEHLFSGPERAALLLMAEGMPDAELRNAMEAQGYPSFVTEAALKTLRHSKTAIFIDNVWLSLVLETPIPPMPLGSAFPGGRVQVMEKQASTNAHAPAVHRTSAPELVTPRSVHLPGPFPLASGARLPELTMGYEQYGVMNPNKDNVILVCHGLTHSCHAAGRHSPKDDKPGWWDGLIGPGKALDTDRWYVLCINCLGGCHGSTGPGTTDPRTGKPYGLRFPVITIADIVDAQKLLLDYLGIVRLRAVIGGCMGGFQVLEWLLRHPERVASAVAISTAMQTSAHTLALWEVTRQAIMCDPHFAGGDYYNGPRPRTGMGLATMFGMLTWMDRTVMERKFGRTRLAGRTFSLEPEFAIQNFFAGLRDNAGGGLDPNSLIFLTRAMDYFDLPAQAEPSTLFAGRTQPVLLLSYTSDWRYPPQEMERLRAALRAAGMPCTHNTLDSPFGHGAFHCDPAGVATPIREFLRQGA